MLKYRIRPPDAALRAGLLSEMNSLIICSRRKANCIAANKMFISAMKLFQAAFFCLRKGSHIVLV